MPINIMKGEVIHLRDILRGVVRAMRLLKGNDIERFREVLSTARKERMAS